MSTATAGSILLDMAEAEYHARPELSSTEARLILDAPAKYRWRKDNPPIFDPTVKFDIGSAVHSKVLGSGYDVVVLDYPDYRTKAAQSDRDEVREAGQVPVLREQYVEVEAMAESVLAHKTARALFDQSGAAEVSVFATDPVTGVDVRARFDYLPAIGDRRLVAVDLKTTINASKRAFEKSVATYFYDVQRAWYLDTLTWAVGPFDEAPEMVFVAVEKEAPYMVAVHQLPAQWANKGHRLAAIARDTYRECKASGVWPGLPGEIQLLDEPTWHVYEIEERFNV